MSNLKKNSRTKDKKMQNPNYKINLEIPTKKKRGRPSKAAKAKELIEMMEHIKKPAPVSFDQMEAEAAHEANIQRLISERAPVHWEEVAQKQEVELNVLRQENEELARICVQRWETIEDWKKLVKYLEGRVEDLTIRSR